MKHPSRLTLWTVLCGLALSMQSVSVGATSAPEYFFPQPVLPPSNSVYLSTAQSVATYTQGTVIRDVRHRSFTQNYPLPALGTSQTETFSSAVDYALSTDNGLTFQPASGTANVTVQVTHTQDVGGTMFFDTEMLQLDLSGGSILLRESPTLHSTGQTTVRPVAGGYMISSFFDIFTELKVVGGQTWYPADQAGHVELRTDTKNVDPVWEPTNLLPPPNDQYVSSAQGTLLYGAAIVIKVVRQTLFSASFQPPPAGPATCNFNSVLDMQVSTDGGHAFSPVRVTVPTTVTNGGVGSTNAGRFDTEMTSLGGTGGFIVSGAVRVRESPTEPSRGQTQIDAQADGTYRITSFFDIFTEISTDGGATWHSTDNGPVRMQLSSMAPEQIVSVQTVLPPGEYIQLDKWFAYYAQGIIISNFSQEIFLSQYSLPTSGSVTDNFACGLQMDVWLPGQQPIHVVSSAPCTFKMSTTTKNVGSVRYFDTEMLSLNISGLPNGMMIRESPTKQSVGRLSSRPDPNNPGQFRVSSFFDVFNELSTDGGQTWSASTSAPPVLRLRSPIGVPAVTTTCPADITVTASGPGGAVVSYTVTAGGGCDPPPTVVANPPSGSTFPVGTSTVMAVASDTCGNSATCSFLVTVNPRPSLTITFDRQLSTVTVSWPSPSTGFGLEETPRLDPANWSPVPPTNSDNLAIKSIVVPASPGNRFYRLKK